MLINESVSRICKIKQDLQDLQDLLGVWFIMVSRRRAVSVVRKAKQDLQDLQDLQDEESKVDINNVDVGLRRWI